jgi:hypothetical protein
MPGIITQGSNDCRDGTRPHSPAIPVGHAAVGIYISHRSLRLICSSETFICRERSKMRALAVISAGVAAGTPLMTLHYQPGTAE